MSKFFSKRSFQISGSFSKPAPAAPIRSIAVLPLESIGSAGADEYLKLGMADALITKLGSLSQVVVRPTSAVRSYVGVATDPLTAGRKLGVDAVLDGNVQKVDDRIRVTVQLLRVSDGKSLWSEKFDEKFTHIFAVQDSISEKVARAVLSKLSGRELTQITKRFTDRRVQESHRAFPFFASAVRASRMRVRRIWKQGRSSENDRGGKARAKGVGGERAAT